MGLTVVDSPHITLPMSYPARRQVAWKLVEAKIVNPLANPLFGFDFIGAGVGDRFPSVMASVDTFQIDIEEVIFACFEEHNIDYTKEGLRSHYVQMDWRGLHGNGIVSGPGWFVRYKRVGWL